MANEKCAIWTTTPAQILEDAGEYLVFDSPRAGGKYWISHSALSEMVPYNDRVRLLLTTWLCEQRRTGVDIPKVKSDVLRLAASRQPLTVTTRMTAGLKYLGQHIVELGDAVWMGSGGFAHTLPLLAETESRNLNELSQLFRMLKEQGFVEGQFNLDGSARVLPTARGWQEIEELYRSRADASQVFVAMWFGEQMSDAFVHGIEPAIRSTGYRAIRIDKKEHNNKIDDEIIAEIRRSRFLVADFTCEPKNVRGGVYYEAGFAQGIGIPVIWTCKNTSIDDLHFDTRQYSHLVWKTPEDLFVQLKNRIGATIGDGPLSKSQN